MKRRGDIYSASSSLIVTCTKRMLPVALDATRGSRDGDSARSEDSVRNHELLDTAVKKMCNRETDDEVRTFIRTQLELNGGQVRKSHNIKYVIIQIRKMIQRNRN